MAIKKAFVEAPRGDYETPRGHRSSLLSSAFEVIDAMEGLVRPIIDASMEEFDGLEAEYKVQIRKFRGNIINVVALADEKSPQSRCVPFGV